MAVEIIDGVRYRRRRGKLVKIPDGWNGRITTRKTIRERRIARDVKRTAKGRKMAIGPEIKPEISEWDDVDE